MDKEFIKNELIKRVSALPKKHSNGGAIKDMIDRLGNADVIMKQVTPILNDILSENNVEFKDNEKEELLEYIKPTVIELITSSIKK